LYILYTQTAMLNRLALSIWIVSFFENTCLLPVLGFNIPNAFLSTKIVNQNELKSRMFEAAQDTETMIGSEEQPLSDSTQKRMLGSQELLMLPRQYGPHLAKNDKPFPQMSHVSAVTLSSTPKIETLSQAIDEAMAAHPLLRCHIEGDGEPTKRIDLFQMVREGEPNPCTFVCPPFEESNLSSKNVLSIIDVDSDSREELKSSWTTNFAQNLDNGDWCDVSTGPLWKVQLHRLSSGGLDAPCALVFTFNHAISDQSSANMLIDHIVSNMASLEESGMVKKKANIQKVPISMEDSVLGMNNRFSDVQTDGFSLKTASYVAGKASEGLRNPVILPDTAGDDQKDGSGFLGALTIISGSAPGGESDDERKSTVQFRTLNETALNALLKKCKENGVTLSNALTAAVAFSSSDFIDGGNGTSEMKRNYKILQSLDMRRFGGSLDKCETVACMAGSHDLMLGPLPDRLGESLRKSSSESRSEFEKKFWELAKESKRQTESFIESEGPQQATRVFDFAMTISDMNNLVHLSAQSKESKGRAYSAGIVNAGVFERQYAVQRGNEQRETIHTQHGRYQIEEVYFAASHARSGCLYQSSCLTVNNQLLCTFHPAEPIVDDATNSKYADSFIELLQIINGEMDTPPATDESASSVFISNLKNVPTLAAVAFGVVGIGIHANAWSQFFSSVLEMKESVADPNDFWAALNFWIFFAVGHPVLQPILWISDVLHGTSGPMIGGLVPALFLLGNIAVIYVTLAFKEIRNAANIFALSAFFAYVGAGLDGQAGLGDFNLALDDNYNGAIVKGCPSYQDVRQSSMDNFDITKYEGLWYEQKFHDWTQFKEVYDTTLDIKLTSDGKGWIDDFGVRGPAPDAAPLSWDKSPVANGAHYFLFGRIDENDPPGILREKGFGVEFPNYIVDVKKDPETGEYQEAIQFQCLERGGVRVFEGINFMSRKPTMTEQEVQDMHGRAEKAGMYPYGASPEQMHTVARKPVGSPNEDNSWQAMWRAIGVDKLLELLTESIEDGGR